jgi:hypothetical protein
MVESSLQDAFKFIHLRIARQSKPAIEYKLRSTATLARLAQEPPQERRAIAETELSNMDPDSILESEIARGLVDAFTETNSLESPTVQDFFERVPEGIHDSKKFLKQLSTLSDVLALSAFATESTSVTLQQLQQLFRLFGLIEAAGAGASIRALPLRVAYAGSIRFPSDLFPKALGSEGAVFPHPVRSIGVADLMVLKQHIKRYEPIEIAHVENIMAHETRERTHRALQRFEETFSQEVESKLEREQELETTERFELNRESERTQREDQKYGFDLNISGKYGPTVEFQTGFDMEISTSTEETQRSATNYAREVVDRSLERIEERVRTERVRKIIRENEERNLHRFENETPDSARGIYQFLDRIYEAQVFNYGKRQMFDLIIPEPASFLWYLKGNSGRAEDVNLPEPPPALDFNPLDIEIDDPSSPLHFTALAKKFTASGLTAPPPFEFVATFSMEHPEGTGGSDGLTEEGDPRSARRLEASIPPGYKAVRAVFNAIALTDDAGRIRIGYNFENKGNVWAPSGREIEDLGAGAKIARIDGEDVSPIDLTFAENDKFTLSVLAFETANYSITGQVYCERTPERLDEWKMKTYDALVKAYQDQLLVYQDELARIEAKLETERANASDDVGLPPARRQQIVITELKKHCMSILLQEADVARYLMRDRSPLPPAIRFAEARWEGDRIRFFEQAFEWNQMQWAFYPYFWGPREVWEDRFQADDADYEFQQFLQAGSARVVFPVRPGFERAVTHYLETGEIWDGTGGPPEIGDEMYLNIVNEILEQRGAETQEPIPVGEPFDIRLPTSLVMLRIDETLPKWMRTEDSVWSWRAVEEE